MEVRGGKAGENEGKCRVSAGGGLAESWREEGAAKERTQQNGSRCLEHLLCARRCLRASPVTTLCCVFTCLVSEGGEPAGGSRTLNQVSPALGSQGALGLGQSSPMLLTRLDEAS